MQTLRPRALVLAGAVGVLAGALLAGACAYTTSSAVLPSHLRTVAVPVFENATSEYTLQQEITDAVVERLVRDNRLKVVDERSADCVVRGKVTEYKNSVFGFSAQNRAQEYRVAITVQIVFKDQVKNREMWRDDTMVKTANYYVQDVPGQTARTELDGRKEAIQKIADEILSRSTQGW